jgi:hypothetical protein
MRAFLPRCILRIGSVLAIYAGLSGGASHPGGAAMAAQIVSLQLNGLWQGGAFTNDVSHQFSHCSAWVPYKSGITMYVTVNRAFAWNIAFAHPAWNLANGQQIPLSISFDGLPPWSGFANALNVHTALVPMADNSSLINSFRGAYQMNIVANGQVFGFHLDGTSRLMLELTGCVRTQLAIERGEQPAFSYGQPRVVNPPAAFAPPPPAAFAPPAQGQPELIATRIASNLLLQTRLPNAYLLSQSEMPQQLRGHGVAWRSDVGAGAVEIVSQSAGKDPQQVASNVIAADGASCKGDFASGRSSELVDDKVVAKAFTACKDQAGSNVLHYFVMTGADGRYVVYVLLNGTASPPPADSPLSDSVFQAAAVKAMFAQ